MKISRWIIFILILSLLVNVKIISDLSFIKREISRLESNIWQVNDTMSNRMSHSIYQMEQTLKKEVSLVNEFKYDFLEIKDKKAEFLLSLKPRIYNENEELFFLVKAGEKEAELIPTESKDNIIFTAKISPSIFDDTFIDLVIESDSSKKTETLEPIYSAIDKFALDILACPEGGSIRYVEKNKELLLDYRYSLNYTSPYNESSSKAPKLRNVELNIEVNKKLIDKFPIPEDSRERYQHSIKLEAYKIPCDLGDEVFIYASANDDRGFNYKLALEALAIDTNGSLNFIEHSRYPYDTVEIK